MDTIKLGSHGAAVMRWQDILGIEDDGAFGSLTEAKTKEWQASHGLTADGIVGPRTWARACETIGDLGHSFLEARHFTRASRTHVDLVVIHTMEAPENGKTAERVAAWFASENSSEASAHYNVDSDSIVQSVHEKDVAWHAGPVNGYSIGIEHAGYARQSVDEWFDFYSRAMLERSAQLVGNIVRRNNIPIKKLDGVALKNGEHRGICGHLDVTAWMGKGHRDPGPYFPWPWYLSRVAFYAKPLVEVELYDRGERYEVSPVYWGPVSLEEAARLARAQGFQLPTPALVDAIWQEADLKISPHPLAPNHGAHVPSYAIAAEALDDATKGKDFHLLAGSHKDVVRTDAGELALYGWHRPDGSKIQPVFTKHAPDWIDYSQGARFVRRL